jgi:signal transduction histidine kinase
MAWHEETTIVPRPPLLQRITPAQWIRVDVVMSLLFFAGGLGHLVTRARSEEHTSSTVFIVLLALASLPIAGRRRFPVGVLALVTAALSISTMLGQSFAPEPWIALPLYTVTVTHDRRSSLVALGLVGMSLAISLGVSLAFRPAAGDVTFNFFLAAATWFVGDSVRARRTYIAGLAEQAAQRQRRELERVEQSIAEERLRIARELHDVIAHSLSVIAVQSGVGRHVIDSRPDQARDALAAVEKTSRAALQDLRSVLGALRRVEGDEPALTPAPGIGDLEGLVDQIRAAGVPVKFHTEGEHQPFPQSVELSVYRIVQEALTNVVKHAGPAEVAVDVTFDDEAILIEVVDNGRGSTNGAPGPDGVGRSEEGAHHGIVGMRERAGLFGGSLSAGPRPGGGFRVLARLPVASGAP